MTTAAISAERRGLYDRLILLLFVLLAPFGLSNAREMFDDGDVSWHIATGRWILDHGIPAADPFSHTMPGHPWVAHEWLPDIIYALAYNAAGYPGVAAVVGLALLALFAIIALPLRRQVAAPALVIALLAMVIVLAPFTLARPHVLVWPLVAGWTALLLHYRDSGRAPPLAAALLMTLWTNMHGSFPLGLVIAGAIALDALVKAGWRRDLLVRWLVFGLASTAAACLNANGLAGLTYPFATLGMETLPTIEEWKPSSPDDTPYFYVALLAAIGLCLYRGAKLRIGEILLLLFLLAMAFSQVRHQTWLAIVAVLILPPRLSASAGAEAPGIPRRTLVAGLAAAALLLIAGRLLLPVVPAENRFAPRTALAHLPPELRGKPVFNEYSFGGPLILDGIKPYIDGRADMYGDRFLLDYREALDGDPARFDQAVQRYNIAWTMLPPGNRLAKRLDGMPGWRRIYADQVAVIHARAGAN